MNPFNYRKDPAEGFAEAYLVTNGGRWSGIVKRKLFYPGPRARRIIETDVTDPWVRRTTQVKRIRGFRKIEGEGKRKPIYVTRGKFRTPLDGSVRVSYRQPRRSGLFVFFFAGGLPFFESIIAELKAGRQKTLRLPVCGERRIRFEAISKRPLANAKITLAKP